MFNLDATNMKMRIRKYKSSSWKILTSSKKREDEDDDDNALGNGEGKPGRREVLFVPSPPLSPPPSAPPLHSPLPPLHSHLHQFILSPLIYLCIFSLSSLFSSSSYSSPSFASLSSVHSSTKKYDYKFTRNIMMLPHTNTVEFL